MKRERLRRPREHADLGCRCVKAFAEYAYRAEDGERTAAKVVHGLLTNTLLRVTIDVRGRESSDAELLDEVLRVRDVDREDNRALVGRVRDILLDDVPYKHLCVAGNA